MTDVAAARTHLEAALAAMQGLRSDLELGLERAAIASGSWRGEGNHPPFLGDACENRIVSIHGQLVAIDNIIAIWGWRLEFDPAVGGVAPTPPASASEPVELRVVHGGRE